MKKINKYVRNAETSSLQEELKKYKQMSQSFRKQSKPKASRKLSPLSIIIPFAAASLSPFAIQAQCGVGTDAPGIPLGDGEMLDVDLDGDMVTDIQLDASIGPTAVQHDLYVRPVNGAQVLGTGAAGAYQQAVRFAGGEMISSANANWTNKAFLTMDYQATGPWHNVGTIEVGFLAIKLSGGRLGFLEVSWNNNNADVNVDMAISGVQDATQAANTTTTIGNCALLPIELLSFEGELTENKVLLKWKTAIEANNRGFDIERSMDGVNFEAIGFVAGQGNSSIEIDYQFIDENARPNRQYYYRLKQIDFWQGNFFSDLISIQTERTLDFDLSPNPTSGDQLNVRFSTDNNDDVELSIFDMQGRMMGQSHTVRGDSDQTFEMDIHDLVSGTYFVKLTTGNLTEYKKFIKQN